MFGEQAFGQLLNLSVLLKRQWCTLVFLYWILGRLRIPYTLSLIPLDIIICTMF